MQVSVETTSSLERRLTIGVPAEKVDSKVNERLQKAAGNVRIDGFRPGKVPMAVMQKRFGPGVRQEVLGEVIGESFNEAVNQENLKPAGQPSIEPKMIEAGQDLEFIATFEVYPEIELADFSGISVEKPASKVTDADLNEMIGNLRKQHATFEVAERAAQDGDRVTIDYKGTKDGEEFAGGSAEGSDLVVGSGRMIPGFEEGLIGLSAGESKTLELSFPEDYHAEELKGAAVVFEVSVNQVAEEKLAELNEEFYGKFGVTNDSEEEFRLQVNSNMEREMKSSLRNKLKGRLFEELQNANAIEVPSSLIAGEVQVLRNQMVQQFGAAAGQMDLSIFPDTMFEDRAERRVKLGLLIGEVINHNDIQVDNERVKSTIEDLAASYADPDEVRNYYYGNKEQLASVEALVLEDQVVDRILESASVVEKECNYQEAVTPDPEPLRVAKEDEE